MELTLRITDPAELTRFATLLSGLCPTMDQPEQAQTDYVAAPAVAKSRSRKPASATESEPKPVQPIAEAPAEEPATEEAAAPTEVIPTEKLRAAANAKMVADPANKARIREITLSMAGSISDIPAERRAEFLEKIAAL